ncbi:hypothetical protein [Winogradskyella sp.]|uniref:hypothetical protein n=1 Tax=Winogradskyella sp. TaxID=1883156 RepID=UPI00261F6A49|nr:hypothetical protein [Winogradskyella sp.]
MDSLNYINSLLKGEYIVKIEKESEIGFWDWQYFSWLSFFMSRKKDLLLITEERIVYMIGSEIIKNIEYNDFSKITFNVMTSRIHFTDLEHRKRYIGLNDFRVTYEEIQYLKSKINVKSIN